MNLKIWVTAGALTCAEFLWAGRIMVGSQAAANETAGTILDNLGCQRTEGRIWCDVQQLSAAHAAMRQPNTLRRLCRQTVP